MTTARSSERSLGFIARAAALMSVLYGVYYYPYGPDSAPWLWTAAFLRAQALSSGALIALFDADAQVHGALITGAFPLEVVRSCSSLDAQALYAEAVLAFPARLRSKLLGLALGFVVLTALNVARIASLYFVGAHAPRAFDAIHEELLPLLLIAAACGCFAAWATRFARGSERREAA